MAMLAAACSSSGGETAAPSPTPSATSAHQEIYKFPEAADGRGWDFAIPVPAWPSEHVGEHATYTDPNGRLTLQTDRVPLEQEDPLSGLRALAKKNQDPGYKLTSLAEHAPVASSDAAEWDFTYQRDGVTRQVRLVGVGIGEVLITIRFEAPQPDFEANQSVLADALEVAAPG
jgi:hypothetical protein